MTHTQDKTRRHAEMRAEIFDYKTSHARTITLGWKRSETALRKAVFRAGLTYRRTGEFVRIVDEAGLPFGIYNDSGWHPDPVTFCMSGLSGF